MGNSAFAFTGGGGGGGSDPRYTNATPTPIGVGGIGAGSTFNDQSFPDFVERMFYPYQYPSFTSFGLQGISGTLEVGATIPASVVFQWSTANSLNIQTNSIGLQDITAATTLATNQANSGSKAITLPGAITHNAVASQTFRVTGVNTLVQGFQRDATYNWAHRAYYGGNASPTINAAALQALDTAFPVSSVAGVYPMNAAGYKYICIPDVLSGQINSVKDPLNFDMPMAGPAQGYTNVDGGGFGYQLVTITNSFSVNIAYRVYRTFNLLGSSTVLTVH